MMIFRGPLDKLDALLSWCGDNDIKVLYIDRGTRQGNQRFWLKAQVPPVLPDMGPVEELLGTDEVVQFNLGWLTLADRR